MSDDEYWGLHIVLKGIKNPNDCELFKINCTPQNPMGPCMVSSEGTCANFYKYK